MQNTNETQTPDKEKTGSKRKLYLTRAAGVAILLAVILSVNHFASMAFDKSRVANYYNYDLRRLKEENKDIDMVVLGASQVFYACNTDLIAGELGDGGEVIDCASAGSYCDGMYYMLKDLLNRFTPKCVLIDLPWSKLVDYSSESTSRYLSSDKMLFPGKLDYMVHCLTPEECLAVLCPIYRYGKRVLSLNQVRRNYADRKAVQEGNWVDESERTYRKNGFVWEDKSCPEGGIPALLYSFSDEAVREDYVGYVKKMVELCNEKQIPVALMTTPASSANIYGIENYQACADYTQSLADELGCPYLNFNLLKDRDELFPDTLYWDTRHMNGEGSVAFAPVLADIASKTFRGEDTSDLFYENLEEMKKDVHRIVACNGTVTPNGDGTIGVETWSFQSEDITPEYRLLLVPDNIDDNKKKAGKDAVDENGKSLADDEDDRSADDDIGENDAADGDATDKNGSVTNGDAAVENDNTAGSAEAQNDSGSKDETDASTDTAIEFQELRPWQEETFFSINESEIPQGYVLRLEVRQKGKEEFEAFQNRLGSV